MIVYFESKGDAFGLQPCLPKSIKKNLLLDFTYCSKLPKSIIIDNIDNYL